MNNSSDFFKKSIYVGLMSAVNSGVIGLGGIWIAKIIGPDSRGELTKMLLIFTLISILTEFGVLGAATYFASIYPSESRKILKYVNRTMIRNYLVIGVPSIILLSTFDFLSNSQIIVILIMLFFNNMITGPSHILQGIDIVLWRKTQLSQSLIYLLCFFFLYNLLYMNTITAFIIALVPGVFSGIFARMVMRKSNKGVSLSEANGNQNLKKSFYKYGRSGFLLVLATEVFIRLDLIVAAIILSNSDLGTFSLILSWLMISTPFTSAIGNIVFPEVSRTFSNGDFRYGTVLIYLRNTLFTSLFFAFSLVVLIPIMLTKIMSGIYEGYSGYVIPMAFLVVIKQLNSVISEIARGLNLSSIYALLLLLSFFALVCLMFLFKPSSAIDILVLVGTSNLINVIASIIMIRTHIAREASK